MRSLAFMVLAIMMASPSYASRVYYTRYYNVGLHFTSHYYNKPIISVTAHIGIQKGGYYGPWYHVQDVPLSKTASGQFMSKIKMVDNYTNGETNQYLLVTYKVIYDNYLESWTPVQGVPSTNYGTFYEGCNDEKANCLKSRSVQEFLEDMNQIFYSSVPSETSAGYFTTYH
ncbi:MAG: hypothetical protein KDD61_05170 [Bdellovibrionales bacterium]|nr:hypothetical protein [Bdellovibrionales bacterium]